MSVRGRPRRVSPLWRLSLAVPLLLVAAVLPAGAASADTPVTITFDAAPAVVGQSAATAYPEVTFNPSPVTNNLSDGCTPVVVAETATSSRPNAVSPKCPSGEFDVPGALLGVLSSGSTASVSLGFGGYGTSLATTPFVLEGFDSGNQLVASASAAGAPGTLTVTAPQPTITSFRIRPGDGGLGFRFWVDDITWTPSAVPLPADFVLSRAPGGSLSLLEGATSDPQPLTVTPVNGSAGQVTWSVTGLPSGVTAVVTPTATGGALRFTTAEGTSGVTGTVTVTATPVDAATGPGPRSVTFPISVSSSLTLAAPARIDAPVCGPAPIGAVAFGPTAPGVLSLTMLAPVPGLSVRLQTRWLDGTVTEQPTATFVTGVNADSASFSLLVVVDSAKLPAPTAIATARLTLKGSGRTRTKDVTIRVRRPVLTLTPTTVRPRHEVPTVTENTTPPFDQLRVTVTPPVRLCPGTTVKVGAAAPRAADLAVDGSFVRLTVPRDATSGAVQVHSPWFGTASAGPLTVRTFRGTTGFPFVNYRPGFDLGDMWEAFGWDVFFKIPVLPGIDIPTPIPSPEAGILLGVANTIFDGACFGISRTAADLQAQPSSSSLFAPKGAPDAWHLTGPGGPSDALRHRIAARHLTQLSPEFLHAYLDAKAATGAMSADQLRAALAAALRVGNTPYLMLDGSGKQHVVLAYDVRPAGAGAWDIDVYDPNVPFTAAEQAPTPKSQLAHANALARSTVRVAANGDWSLTGGTDVPIANTRMQGLALMTAGQIPTRVSMIKLAKPGDLEQTLLAVFGGSGSGTGGGAAPARITALRSGGRSVTTAPATAPADSGARLLAAPLLDAGGVGAGGEGWAVRASGAPVEVSVSGTGRGSYRQTVLANGFGGSVTVPSATGRSAVLTYDPAGGSVSLRHAAAPGRVVVETTVPDGHGGTRTASLTLPGSSGGTEVLAVSRGGDVVVQHSGPPVTATLALTGTRRTATATSTAAVPLGTGTTTVRPAGWDRTTGTITVTGSTGTARVPLRGTAKPTVRAAAPTVRTVARTRVATARISLRGAAAGDLVSATWAAVRGKKVVSRATLPVTGRGATRIATWTLPTAARGARVVVVPVLTRTRGLAVTTVTGRPAAGR